MVWCSCYVNHLGCYCCMQRALVPVSFGNDLVSSCLSRLSLFAAICMVSRSLLFLVVVEVPFLVCSLHAVVLTLFAICLAVCLGDASCCIVVCCAVWFLRLLRFWLFEPV